MKFVRATKRRNIMYATIEMNDGKIKSWSQGEIYRTMKTKQYALTIDDMMVFREAIKAIGEFKVDEVGGNVSKDVTDEPEPATDEAPTKDSSWWEVWKK